MDAAQMTSRVGGGHASLSSSSSGGEDRKPAPSIVDGGGGIPLPRQQQSEEQRQVWPLFVGCSGLPSFPVKQKRAPVSSSSAASSYCGGGGTGGGDDTASVDTGYDASCSSYSRSAYSLSRASACSSPSSSMFSLGDSSLDDLDESYFLGSKLQARLPNVEPSSLIPSQLAAAACGTQLSRQFAPTPAPNQYQGMLPAPSRGSSIPVVAAAALIDGKSPLLAIGSDVTANVLSFLDPPEILRVLTSPLCKEWRQVVTSHQDLWKVLCLMEPFKANVAGSTGDGRNADGDSDDDDDDDDDSFCSILDTENDVNDVFGKYRIMYTSFVRCYNYITRIKEDAENGRPPSSITAIGAPKAVGGGAPSNRNLTSFLSRAQGVVVNHTTRSAISGSAASANGRNNNISSAPIGVSDDGYSTDENAGETPTGGNGRKVGFAKWLFLAFVHFYVLRIRLLT